MKKDVEYILIGGGGHGRVLSSVLKKYGINEIIIADKSLQIKYSHIHVKKIITDDEILKYDPNKTLLINGMGHLNIECLRVDIFNYYKSKGYTFASVVDPSAIIDPTVKLGEGVQVLHGTIVQINSKIKSNTIINTGAIIEHDCVIGESSHIAPGAVLCGHVAMGDQSIVGAGATVINNQKISDKTFIKANSLYYKN